MGTFVSYFYGLTFKTFGGVKINLGDVAVTVKNIYKIADGQSSLMSSGYSTLHNATSAVSGGIVAVSLSVLTLMVLIDFIQQALRFNRETSWEMILFTMVKFAVYVFLINNSRRFFKDCFSIGVSMLNMGKLTEGGSVSLKEAVKKTVDGSSFIDFKIPIPLHDPIDVGKPFSIVITGLIFLLMAIPLLGMQLSLYSQVFIKFLKYAALAFISPMPIALSYGGGGPAARGFIMQVISSILDIVFTFFILIMYSKGFGLVVKDDFNQKQLIETVVGLYFYTGLFNVLIGQTEHITHDMVRG